MTTNGQRALTLASWTVLIVLGAGAGIAVHRLWEFRAEVERLADRLSLDAGPESTLVYDADNNLISALFEEHRIAVPLDEISPHLVNAVLVTEDRRFYDHDGLDLRRIVLAALANHRAGEIVQGGSTITQQLVRSILLNREKSYTRKLKEAVLARRLEEQHTKRAILESYLNRVYFGDGYYGVEAAAVGYFGKTARDLDAVEAATLAGLIKGPSHYSPTRAPERARARRDLVLREMHSAGVLGETELAQALAVPIEALIARGDSSPTPDPRRLRGAEYFRDTVARELLERFGHEAVYTGGLRVYTTLDRRLQTVAEEVISSRLKRLPRSRGEVLQGALVAIEPTTGFVRAIVGGRDFEESPFNRAIDARRQPGSAFKPFIFAQALESGYSPSTLLEGLSQPIETNEGPWLPGGEHELQSVRLRDALVTSSNRAAAHLLQQVGIRSTLDLVSRFGITSELPAVPSLALGTGEVTLFELTSAYGVFANRGTWRQPTTIRRVLDRYGRELYRASDVERSVVSEATAFLMTSMMADVMNRGTASTARVSGFTLQAAGKTGTSNDYTDAWFVGYTPHLVTGVWIGYDQPRMIMDRGFASVVAVPAWARFMMAATERARDDWFVMPGSLVTVRLCRLSGLLATDRCHLPVAELPGDAAVHPDRADAVHASTPVLQPGGVYEELRRVGSLPAPCPLFHADADTLHATFDLHEPIAPAPGTWDYDDEPEPQFEVDPPPAPEAVTPIVPGQSMTRPPDAPTPVPPGSVIPGSRVSRLPPVPPGNRPPN